jgi:cell division GTPase FtsZ
MSENKVENRVVVTDDTGEVSRVKTEAEIVKENQELEKTLKAKSEQLDPEVLKKLKEKKEESMKAVSKRDRSLYFGVVGLGQAGCVDRNTQIYTSTHGIIPIESFFYKMLNKSKLDKINTTKDNQTCVLLDDEEVFTISMDPKTGETVKSKVTAVWKNRTVSKNKITLENGSSITCSKKHPSLVFRPKSARKAFFNSLNTSKPLCEGDRLVDTRFCVFDKLSQKTYVKGIEITEDLAWLLGVFAGDGHDKKHGNEISFYSNNITLGNKIVKVLQTLPGTSIKRNPRPGCEQISVYGLNVRLFFEQAFEYNTINTNGGFGKKTYSIQIPSCISKGFSNIRVAFLAGLIDSDGTVSKNWCETSIFTCSKTLADQTGCLISSIGGRPHTEFIPSKKQNINDGFRVKMLGKINHGPLMVNLVEQITHSEKKERIANWYLNKQKSFATSSVPLKYDELSYWMKKDSKLKSNQELKKISGVNINNWVNDKQKLSLNSFNKVMNSICASEQIEYVKGIAPKLITISSTELLEDKECQFYDLTVEGHENYIAGNNGLIFTHNSRITETFYGLGYEACVFNTATQDLEHISLPNDKKIFLPFALGGAGKELDNGRQAVEQNGELVINKLNESFGDDQEMLILAVSGGGGTGSGGAEGMLGLMSTLGKPIGVIYVLPMESEDALSKHNSVITLGKLAKMASTDVITTLIVVDNSKIELIYPGLSKAEFWGTANNAIVEPLHLFNYLSAQPTKYDSLDSMDFGRVFTTGDCTTYGMLEVENYMDTTAIAEAIVENLEGGLLANDFNLKETRFGGFIITGNPDVLAKLPAVNVNYASHMISEACDSPSLVNGVYEQPITKDVVRVYTLFSGLGLPSARVEGLKTEAAQRMAVLKEKEASRADKMAVDYGAGTDSQSKAQEVHRIIQQKKSGFGKLTSNAGRQVKDRRKR